MSKAHGAVGKMLDELEKLVEDNEKTTMGEVVEVLGQRSFGPFLLLPALLEMSPVGGIPGVPTVLAAIIVLFAAQIVIGRKHMWLPGFLERRSLRTKRIGKAMPFLRKAGSFLDRWFHGRIKTLTRGAWLRAAAICVIVLALTVPPLELLPFASTAPMAAIAAFGLAMLVGDGLLMLAAFLCAGLAFAVGFGMIGRG